MTEHPERQERQPFQFCYPPLGSKKGKRGLFLTGCYRDKWPKQRRPTALKVFDGIPAIDENEKIMGILPVYAVYTILEKEGMYKVIKTKTDKYGSEIPIDAEHWEEFIPKREEVWKILKLIGIHLHRPTKLHASLNSLFNNDSL